MPFAFGGKAGHVSLGGVRANSWEAVSGGLIVRASLQRKHLLGSSRGSQGAPLGLPAWSAILLLIPQLAACSDACMALAGLVPLGACDRATRCGGAADVRPLPPSLTPRRSLRRSILLTPERACSLCYKRIGGAAFVALPTGLLTHYSCFRKGDAGSQGVHRRQQVTGSAVAAGSSRASSAASD